MRSPLFLVFLIIANSTFGQVDYSFYHQKVISIESQIVKGEITAAYKDYLALIDEYEFVFLKDLKVAAQLAALEKDTVNVLKLLNQSIHRGWTIKGIKKAPLLKGLTNDIVEPPKSNPTASYRFIDSLFRLDQKMAWKGFIRLRENSKQKFYDNLFADHSQIQLSAIIDWLQDNPWPGQRSVGNGYMASTIVSHHNSISPGFNKTDTLFQSLDLINALQSGYLSPFHYALMHDWRCAVSSRHDRTCYGFIGAIKDKNHMEIINSNRAKIGMRSIELRNQLIDVTEQIGIKFYLEGSPWQPSKISLQEK